VAETVRRVASTGYVRNQLLVFDGGALRRTRAPAHSGTNGAAGGTGAVQNLAGQAGLAEALAVESVAASSVTGTADLRLERLREARLKGYEGDSCGECGNFTLVRNGTCLKCATCGATSGCS
jgi:ribonucleoside-diphosphate reductase alpha chain